MHGVTHHTEQMTSCDQNYLALSTIGKTPCYPFPYILIAPTPMGRENGDSDAWSEVCFLHVKVVLLHSIKRICF